MASSSSSYQQLESHMARLSAVRETTEMLYWDMATMMPAGGGEARAEQLAVLNTLSHGMLTAPEIPDLLDAVEGDPNLDSWQQANVREIRHRWLKATAIDEKLVEALTRASARCEAKWREARPNNDFKSILKDLSTLLDLVRESGLAKADVLNVGLYDALLDEFEPGGRSDDIDIVFEDIAAFLPDFIQRVLDHQASQPDVIQPEGPFSIDSQRALAETLMSRIGFEFDHGRLDVSLHPFCGGVPDDVRITTRYDEADFTSSLMGVLHETGHALYERGLPKEWRNQPVGESQGMSLHESQSLLIEMQVCRSAAFLEFAAPLMRDAFDGKGAAWDLDNLKRLYTHVEPGFIRVDADEVTYPAHVIVRYRLEKAVLSGDLALADLPGAWNDGMNELLGVTPPNDRLGCLQDLHWYDGAWGYFPTYTLGAMTAAQLYDAAKKSVPGLEQDIRQGDFSPLLEWLRHNIHSKGRSVRSNELLEQATARSLDAEVFKKHLTDRYLST